MTNERFEFTVSNFVEAVIILSETITTNEENKDFEQYNLLIRMCGEILSYCLSAVGNNYIDVVSDHIFKEIIANAKLILTEENEDDS